MRDFEALHAFLASRATMKFAWGSNDCASFCGGAVKALTGRDRLRRLRWADEREAAALLARLGGLERAMNRRFRRIAPALAQRGDIAGVADTELGGLRLMIVEGDTLAGPGPDGIARQPRRDMVRAWSALRDG